MIIKRRFTLRWDSTIYHAYQCSIKAWEKSDEGNFKMRGLLVCWISRDLYSSDISLIMIAKEDVHLFYTLLFSQLQVELLKHSWWEREIKMSHAKVQTQWRNFSIFLLFSSLYLTASSWDFKHRCNSWFMCQLEWIMGCPFIQLNIISGCVLEGVSEEISPWIGRSQRRWALSNQWRAWVEQTGGRREDSFSA